MINKGHNISITLIGLSNAENQQWSDEVMQLIPANTVFSGGDRHLSRIRHLLPERFEWIPIKGKMEAVIKAYLEKEGEKIIVFASGDPFFFGFGNTLRRLLPNVSIASYPYFNSLQRLAHKTQLNYSNLHAISLHGRPWDKLDEALISNQQLIGVLTDEKHAPKKIAKRLLDYGYLNYKIIIGEELDGADEKVAEFSLHEALGYHTLALNCVILKQETKEVLPISFPDHSYRTLEGRPNMITKQSIRMITIQALQLHQAKCFWDVGACTGAIAIEAKRNFPQVTTYAFEKRQECGEIIGQNSKSHQIPGIVSLIGDVFDQNLEECERPQAVFIGGHGGRLKELIDKINHYLDQGGMLVMNTVLVASYSVFMTCIQELKYTLISEEKVRINEHNIIHVIAAQKPIEI